MNKQFINMLIAKVIMKISFKNFLADLEIEWIYQDNKFPNQKHTIQEWIVIIMEEICELSKEVLELSQHDYEFNRIYKELIQCITLLIRLRYTPYNINFHKNTIIL